MFRDKMMQQNAHIDVRSAMGNILKVKLIFNGSLFEMIVIQRIKWPMFKTDYESMKIFHLRRCVSVPDEYQIHALY